jgi:hypothetical protein
MKGLAKKTTLCIMGLAFLGGLIGAFITTFNMEGYINFLKAFVPFFGVMIASIGTNSAVQKIQEAKKNVKQD